MKKLAVMIAIASILSGCMTKDSLNTLKKLVVEKEIKDYVASAKYWIKQPPIPAPTIPVILVRAIPL
ncbi:hypothetical protein ACFXHN_003421 [Acinetobacter baumannii]